MDFPGKWAAIVWICKNQLGRRNLTEAQKSYLRGKQYEAEKMAEGAPVGNSRAKKQHGQNVQVDLTKREIKDGTAGRIGKEYGVNGRTIRRDAEFAKEISMNDRLMSVLEDIAINLERIAEALEALADK